MNTGAKKQVECPLCGAEGSHVLSIENIPLFCNVLRRSESEAGRAERGRLALTFCESCGHLYNRDFEPNRLDYARNVYENRLDHSPYFQDYAEFLARELVNRFSLHSKRVVELGCGSGSFLKVLCRTGRIEGSGFDPAIQHDQADSVNGVRLFRGHFTPEHSSLKPDFIYCRHVLEHLASPVDFLQNTVKIVGKRSVGIFAEVPSSLFVIRDLSIWDLIYEHYSCFSPISLKFLFESAGVDVTWTSEEYGGQFLCIGGFSGEKGTDHKGTDSSLDNLFKSVKQFASLFPLIIDSWSERLERYSGLVLWGAGSKGISFLNLVPNSRRISHVVDINPIKRGSYIPCTGHRVVSPEDLVEIKPDAVLVINPLYLEEIRLRLAELGLDPELVAMKRPSREGALL